MNYFRAMLVKGELSLRVLDLTTEVIKHNMGNYQAW